MIMKLGPNLEKCGRPPLNSHLSKRTDNVLFAMSPEERKLFFPFGEGRFARDEQASFTTPQEIWKTGWPEILRQRNPEVIVSCWTTPPLSESLLQQEGESVRYVCHVTGSVRAIVQRSFIERGGMVSNWGALIAPLVAEHALLLILASLRGLPHWKEAVEENDGFMNLRFHTRSLFGLKVGLHGFGAIARDLIRLLAPFHLEILAYSDGVPDSFIADQGAEPCPTLENLFQRSQILVECEALTSQSRNSVTGALLSLLPPDAVFVNVGRGPVVDETALAILVRAGKVRVASDVSIDDPKFRGSSLATSPGTILSPHIGGPTHDRLTECGNRALQNVEKYLRGEPPEGQVTLAVYDRST